MTSSSARIDAIYRYPVKGLAAESLDRIAVAAGEGVPGDRRYAIARGGTRWDDARPQWLRKESFVMLMRAGDEALAALGCGYTENGQILVLAAPGGETVRADLRTATGRSAASRTLDALLGARPDGGVRVVAEGPLSLTDIPQNGLSIINRASVDDFARRIGRDVHPLRFRANLYLAGVPAWAERDWIGREVRIGAVTVKIAAHIERCNATRVDPGLRSAIRHALLRGAYGHIELGVYADVGGRRAPCRRSRRLGRGAVPSPAATCLRRAGFYARNAWVLTRSWLRG
jgi:uncharacterized protein YcbX